MIHAVAVSEFVGTSYYTPLKGEVKECMRQAAEIGYEGVELHVRSPKQYDYAELGDYAANLGLKIVGLSTGGAVHFDGHYLTNPNSLARKEAIEVVKGFMQAAKDCGGAAVMMCRMHGPLPDPKHRETYKDLFYESLIQTVETAEKLGVELTLEAANRFQASYNWSADETLDFVNRFDSDKVTIHLDSFHMNIEDGDMPAAIRKCKDRLGYFHFSDNDRCYPGHGHIDFKSIVEALNDIGYMKNGIGAYEYDSIPDCITSARLGLEHIKNIEKELGIL